MSICLRRGLRLVQYCRNLHTSTMTLDSVSNQRLEEATRLVDTLKQELGELKRLKINERVAVLSRENEALRSQIQNAIQELVRLETLNGKKQIAVPNQNYENVAQTTVLNDVKVPKQSAPDAEQKATKEPKPKKAKAAPEKTAAGADEAPVDVGRLDFRVGKIIEVNKHPDADSLYVEKVDCGEPNPRTVVSGLVKHIPIEEMQNRLVVLLCNLKPAKMRGITSEAMVMCASSPDKVEILSPPSNAVPGDLVYCEGFSRNPDSQLNPKKRIFETCAPDLLTNASKEACYKGTPLVVPGKGHIVSQTLTGVNVR